jgi:two-component system osmolarity sensor histidine kinase EnvZ
VSRRGPTLLGRTGLTIAAGLGMFLAFSLVVVRLAILEPVTQLAARDLAALLELTAKVWVELPPWTRPDYERELREVHGLRVRGPVTSLPRPGLRADYLDHVEEDLGERLGRRTPIFVDPAEPGWYWIDVPLSDTTLQFGFEEDRFGDQLPIAVILIGIAGALFVFATSLFVVRRMTAPLEDVQRALQRLGRGQPFEPLPEEGPSELAALAARVNRAEREIVELLGNRTTLLAGVSHDLRTPLTRMRLAIELLDPEADAPLVDGIRRDIEEMEQLIERAMDLGRGLERPERASAPLVDLVRAVHDDYVRAGRAVRLAAPIGCVTAVPPKALRRVLGNLLDNALRYGNGEPVDLAAECLSDRAVVRVSDRGPGIPPEEREAVLQPFYRLEGSRSRATGGHGLGLAVVKQLCDANGWRLLLDDAPGGGLEVRVEMPRMV